MIRPFATDGWMDLVPYVLRDNADRLRWEGVMRWAAQSVPPPSPSLTISDAFPDDALGQLLELSKRVGASTLSQTDFDKARARLLTSGQSAPPAASPSSSLTVLSPITHAASVTAASSSPAASAAAPSLSELPLRQVQPSPSEARASTILSPVSPTVLPSQSAMAKSPKCPPRSAAVAATAALTEPSPVSRSSAKRARLPDIVEVVKPPSATSRPGVCDLCSQKKVKCEQESGQPASPPCIRCKARGLACVQSKKAGCRKRAPQTPTASTVAMSVAAESSCDASHFNLASDLDGPVLDLIMGGMVTATEAESSAVRFWHYKAKKSRRLRAMVATWDDWIQDVYLKSLECTVYDAAGEPPAKRARTAALDSTGKGKGRASADAMEEDEVVELAGDGSEDEEGDNEE
ncbi:hypothetical protein EI94DRAFT_1742817 [Lactarius quietus]|nr:hypothetical protein EI94DRAFT_1742817 [Lactarius quietus]